MAAAATTTKRTVLAAGFGIFVQDAALAKSIVEKVEADVARADKLGFEVVPLYIDPKDPDDARKRGVAALKERHWDGFSIGFGVRGTKELTPLFEDLVNAAREITPQTRMMFSTSPDGIVDAIQRVFANAQ